MAASRARAPGQPVEGWVGDEWWGLVMVPPRPGARGRERGGGGAGGWSELARVRCPPGGMAAAGGAGARGGCAAASAGPGSSAAG